MLGWYSRFGSLARQYHFCVFQYCRLVEWLESVQGSVWTLGFAWFAEPASARVSLETMAALRPREWQ